MTAPTITRSKLGSVQAYGEAFYASWHPVFISLSDRDMCCFVNAVNAEENRLSRALTLEEVQSLVQDYVREEEENEGNRI